MPDDLETLTAARYWELKEEGQFPESEDKRPPIELGLTYKQALRMRLDVLAKLRAKDEGVACRIDQAIRRIRKAVSRGPVLASSILADCRGMSRHTVWRAAKRVGVKRKSVGFPAKVYFYADKPAVALQPQQ